MSEECLPKEYDGYSTAELLQIWDHIPDNTIFDPPAPKGKNYAMHGLLYEYALTDYTTRDKIVRCKKLLAPYGINPAPWADENGIRQDELSEMSRLRMSQRSKVTKARAKAQLAELRHRGER